MVANDESSRYLFCVDYQNEAERKRVEYLFKNWESGQIEAPKGLVRIAEGVNRESLHEELVTKVEDKRVEVYKLESTSMDLEEESLTVEQEINKSKDTVEGFLDYILSKKGAVLKEPSQNNYEIYTKKGRAEIRPKVTDNGDSVTIRLLIKGYPPAPSFLEEFFDSEFKEFATSESNLQP